MTNSGIDNDFTGFLEAIPYPALITNDSGRVVARNTSFANNIKDLNVHSQKVFLNTLLHTRSSTQIPLPLSKTLNEDKPNVKISNVAFTFETKRPELLNWNLNIGKINNAYYLILLDSQSDEHRDLKNKFDALEARELEVEKEYEEAQSLIQSLSDVFNSLPDSFVRIDRYNTIEQFNINDEYVLQSKPQLGMDLGHVLIPKLYEEVYDMLRMTRLTDRPRQSEFNVLNSELSENWYEIRVLPLGSSFLISFRDITQKKLEFGKILEREKLSSIGVLAGGLAHQYNNLHHAVSGLLEIGIENISGEGVSYIKKALRRLQKSSDLTKSLLDFARSEPLEEVQPVNAKKVLNNIRTLIRDELLKFNVSLSTPKDDFWVCGHENNLEQVLMNLIINAIHACSHSETREIKVSFEEDQQERLILIEDTGCGIDEDVKSHIFTPLFTTKGEYADAARSNSDIEGTGLGLPLSKRLIESMHGQLTLLKTEPNKGSTFKVSLKPEEPIHSPSISQRKENSPQIPTGNHLLKIMIIDDSPENRLILKLFLEKKYQELLEFDNGEIGPETIKNFDPDIIFVDWLMPKVGGEQFLKNLVQRDLQNYLKKCVILSGVNNSEEIRAWDNKVLCTFEKPLRKEKLFEILNIER